MADITQTRSSVGFKATPTKAQLLIGTAGEAIDPGYPCYLKAADNKYWKARTDTAAEADVVGVSLTSASAEDPIVLAAPGTELDLGATLVVGEVYGLSETDFAIATDADVTSSSVFKCILGMASAADTLVFQPVYTGVATP